MKKRFSEAPIIDISDATYYKGQAKFDGMTISDAQRPKEVGPENMPASRIDGQQCLARATCHYGCSQPTGPTGSGISIA